MEIRKLNTLRGIAALIVVVSHYSNSTGIFNGMLGAGAGQLGVMLFFLISGFLMSYLYMDNSFNKVEVYKFVIARIARVVPLFLLIVLCSYVLQILGIKGVFYNIATTESLLSHLLLLSGTSVLWTIPAEIQFYALFVLFWWLYSMHDRVWLGIVALISVVLIVLNFPKPNGDVFGIPYELSIFRSLPYFFVGMISGKYYRAIKSNAHYMGSFGILVLLIIPLLFPKVFVELFGHRHEMWLDMGLLFIFSFIFYVLLFVVPDDNKILSNRFGDFVGNISYSLYLLHLPILRQLSPIANDNPEFYLIVFLIATLVCSYISYILIEKPTRKMIRSFQYRKLSTCSQTL